MNNVALLTNSKFWLEHAWDALFCCGMSHFIILVNINILGINLTYTSVSVNTHVLGIFLSSEDFLG